MTERKESIIDYLDFEDIELIYLIVSEQWNVDGEPIPSFNTANKAYIDSLIKIPKTSYFGNEQYPSLASKAAILFYTINKKHIFLNGNKRLSVACLIIFLRINKKDLRVNQNEMLLKALELAKTTHTNDFSLVMKELVKWIDDRLIDFDFDDSGL